MSTNPTEPPKYCIRQVFLFINQKIKIMIRIKTQSLLSQELVEESLIILNVTHTIKWDIMPSNAQTRQWLLRKMIQTIKKIKVSVSLSTNTR